ncbi:hypothetical protein PoB_005484500 [Plakobranchus ocellatus]|uniref:Uncharacterized protein n=1 Tax=Plakobranchus ocellatus TaxID=259542 RepID=A0AAV4C9I1_9GAST|nr:hypothetical protein PoB_005484500 [Plakobranchus ocellatus]
METHFKKVELELKHNVNTAIPRQGYGTQKPKTPLLSDLSQLSLSLIVLRYVPVIRAIVGVIGLGHTEVLAGEIILLRVTGHPVLRVTLVQVEVVLLILRPEIGTGLVLIPGVLAGVSSLDLIRAVVLVWPRVVMTSHVISVVAMDMCGVSAQVVQRKLILLVQYLNYLLIVVLLRVVVVVEVN